jgi:hypothetical protein
MVMLRVDTGAVPPLTPTPAITWPPLTSGAPPPIAQNLLCDISEKMSRSRGLVVQPQSECLQRLKTRPGRLVQSSPLLHDLDLSDAPVGESGVQFGLGLVTRPRTEEALALAIAGHG